MPPWWGTWWFRILAGLALLGMVSAGYLYRILIVEDQADNRALLTQLLESVGFQVKVAEHGQQGVDLFQNWKPHFIWMDRSMPVMDGTTATQSN